MDWLNNMLIEETDVRLFDLESHPCLNVEVALSHLNDKSLFILLLQEFFTQEMPAEKQKFFTAFATQDWQQIERLAHKITGGIMYLGLMKMQHACQNLERYYNSGHTKLMPTLFHQLIQVFEETQQAIQRWLQLEKA